MADFRKWVFAFAVVALLFAMGSTANAQPGNQPAFSCTANAGVPPIVRAEGITELVGDLILNCTGGTPTPAGTPIPLSNVTIFLNTNITSRIIQSSSNLSEAVLTIDEPYPSTAEVPTPSNAAPQIGAALNQLGCVATNATNCAITGTGGGIGGQATGPYNGTAGRYNVFQGFQNGVNSIVWLGVPIDAPGSNGTRVIRITNVRGNACQLGVSSTLIPTQIVMFISVNGSQQVTINNPQQTVAFIQPGLIASNGTAVYSQCVNINGTLLNGSAGQTGTVTVTAREGFGSAFKVRNFAQLFAGGGNGASTAVAGLSPANVGYQNVLGYPYNTESGYVSTTPGLVGAGLAGGAVGLADQGTQISFVITNVGAGISLFAPNVVGLFPAGSSAAAVGAPGQTGTAVLVGSSGGSGSSQVTITGGTATITYEVWYSQANVLEQVAVPFTVAAIANTGQNLPALGSSTVAVNFAPLSTVTTASTSAPIPRFCQPNVPKGFFTINSCSCNLLFPFVTNQAGFDTGIALANTSADTLNGVAPQAGPVTITYYGNTTGGGAAPPTFVTQSVPAGTELIWTLSNGGNFGVPATPGFQGYIITRANFQWCHAFAFISDVGSQKLAEGYLALSLDLPVVTTISTPVGLNRTGQAGENEGH